MLTTILIALLAWSVVGGAVAIVDADDGSHRGPTWCWLLAYGPALWGLVVYVVVTETAKHLVKLAERKLRG